MIFFPFIGSAKNSDGLANLASLSDLLSGKCLCTITIDISGNVGVLMLDVINLRKCDVIDKFLLT